jgi:hypothetical protein
MPDLAEEISRRRESCAEFPRPWIFPKPHRVGVLAGVVQKAPFSTTQYHNQPFSKHLIMSHLR